MLGARRSFAREADGDKRPSTAEEFDQMFAAADSRSAMESRLASARNQEPPESMLEATSSGLLATGKEFRREEEY